jgi:hypothetical protein
MKCIQCGTELGNDFNHTSCLCDNCRKGKTIDYPLTGWECPRCRKIHSPFVSECNCPPLTITRTTLNTEVKTD